MADLSSNEKELATIGSRPTTQSYAVGVAEDTTEFELSNICAPTLEISWKIDRERSGEFKSEDGRVAGICCKTVVLQGKRQEDAALIMRLPYEPGTTNPTDILHLLAIDGITNEEHGGGGSTAANVVSYAFNKAITDSNQIDLDTLAKIPSLLEGVFQKHSRGSKDMGAAYLHVEINERTGVCQVCYQGDCQLLILKQSSDLNLPPTLEFVTPPHTKGAIMRLEGNSDQDACLYDHVVMNHIGIFDGVAWQGGTPERYEIKLDPTDIMIVGSDGLFDVISPENIPDLIIGKSDPDEILRALQDELVCRIDQWGMKNDNVTAIVYVPTLLESGAVISDEIIAQRPKIFVNSLDWFRRQLSKILK